MRLSPLEPWILERTCIPTHSREALQSYQLQALKETLLYAKVHSPFYARLLKEQDITAIDSLEAFEQLPLTTPEDIKTHGADFLCVSQSHVKRIVTLNTSGTTGDEKRIFFTQEDLDETIDFFHNGMLSLVNQNDKVMVLLPGSTQGSIGDLLSLALNRAGISCFVHGILQDAKKAASDIQERAISCLVGIPMHVYYLSKRYPELFGKHITKVLLSTDYVPDALVASLKAKGCLVYNHYGMTEMGYGGGVECENLGGYHLREHQLYFEIIDPSTLLPAKEGEYGEVVFTTFRRNAMPLIRYRTGDIARFLPTPCACGSFLRTMEKVQGRMSNTLCLQNTTVSLKELDEIVLHFEEVLDYHACSHDNKTLNITLTLASLDTFALLRTMLLENLSSCIQVPFSIEACLDTKTPSITSSMIKRKITTPHNKEHHHD